MKIDLTKNELIEAVALGVQRAIWQIATNATSMPCADFYDAIARGCAKGVGDASENAES